MQGSLFDIAPLAGYKHEYGLLLATLQDSTREWRDELGEVELDVICWQPYPKGYSVGSVLLHIAEVEAHWIEKFCLGREISAAEQEVYLANEMDQYAGIWPTPPRETLAYYFDILDRVRARTLESVREFEPSDTVKESRWGSLTLRWVLGHVIQHDSYHGGQAVMLKEIAARTGEQAPG